MAACLFLVPVRPNRTPYATALGGGARNSPGRRAANGPDILMKVSVTKVQYHSKDLIIKVSYHYMQDIPKGQYLEEKGVVKDLYLEEKNMEKDLYLAKHYLGTDDMVMYYPVM